MEHGETLAWLREEDEASLQELWTRADSARREHVGDEVHLRGLVEIGNCCRRTCAYCGLNAGNSKIMRYRMSEDEILAAVGQAVSYGYGTVVLQSGEDPALDAAAVSRLIKRIKSETNLAITLSLGEWEDDILAQWKQAGADRYLLRFETSDPELFEKIHPSLPGVRSDRLALLRRLRGMGYEIGSGVMVGIPGQTYEMLARDLATIRDLDLDMIGLGPFLFHPDTAMGHGDIPFAQEGEQVPNTELMTYKTLALARIVCPEANIPSTTALATLNRESGRELGLQRGANVVMPNVTPVNYRSLYQIYPGKACLNETADVCNLCMKGRIESIGRKIGIGRGDSPRYLSAACGR
jgi:biotin synthase